MLQTEYLKLIDLNKYVYVYKRPFGCYKVARISGWSDGTFNLVYLDETLSKLLVEDMDSSFESILACIHRFGESSIDTLVLNYALELNQSPPAKVFELYNKVAIPSYLLELAAKEIKELKDFYPCLQQVFQTYSRLESRPLPDKFPTSLVLETSGSLSVCSDGHLDLTHKQDHKDLDTFGDLYCSITKNPVLDFIVFNLIPKGIQIPQVLLDYLHRE